jgi:ATP-dependent DNA helicase RecG
VRVTLAELAEIPVGRLETVSDRKGRVEALAEVDIHSVLDLLTHYPRRYLDRTVRVDIADAVEGEEAMVLATVRKVSSRRTRQGRTMVEVDFFDGTSYLHTTFFNQPWRTRQLAEGTEAVLVGKVERFRGRRQMTNPVVDLIGDRTGRVVPVYPQSEKAGLTSRDLGLMVTDALDHLVGELADPLPDELLASRNLAGRTWAMRQTHLPESIGASQRGRRRLGFDELLRLQVILVMRKRTMERESIGIRHRINGPLVERFRTRLPFPLTGAQQRAIAEIEADLAGPHPMHRLLQGDVGSGKTLVAVSTLLAAVDGGFQGALMVPTEVLAEQHAVGIRHLLADLEVPATGSLLAERELNVALLTNRTPAAKRRQILAGLAEGQVDILIGTHSLLSDAVRFANLGALVIDEQHRFGVDQRAALRSKGAPGSGAAGAPGSGAAGAPGSGAAGAPGSGAAGAPGSGAAGAVQAVPDVLVMTATPIPRTAAMTVFGDLDTTVLDELPPGRTPITTVWARGELAEAAAWEQVRRQVVAGRQAYVVCPLIDESERVAARSATEEYDRLAAESLAGLRLGLLHGQLAAPAKEEVMADFRAAKIDVLVATTVIEVGVDVPNATVMVIEDAGRFGIAQLHQLRGRVGRGADQSWCYLLGEPTTDDGEARLTALEKISDGFELAEVDLDLRGEGTILGARQKGASDLKLASLRRHRKTVAEAREVAFEIVDADPLLTEHPLLREEIRLLVDDEDREFLFKS